MANRFDRAVHNSHRDPRIVVRNLTDAARHVGHLFQA